MSRLFTMVLRIGRTSITQVDYRTSFGEALTTTWNKARKMKETKSMPGPISVEIREDTAFSYLYGGG